MKYRNAYIDIIYLYNIPTADRYLSINWIKKTINDSENHIWYYLCTVINITLLKLQLFSGKLFILGLFLIWLNFVFYSNVIFISKITLHNTIVIIFLYTVLSLTYYIIDILSSNKITSLSF